MSPYVPFFFSKQTNKRALPKLADIAPRRSDIELAIHCGSAPSFSSKDVPRHLILINETSTDNSGPHSRGEDTELRASALYQSVCVGLRPVVLDILRLSHVLDEASHAHKLDPAAYQATLLYVGYRLLENKLPPKYRYYDGPEIAVGDSSSSSSSSVSVLDTLVEHAMIGFQSTFSFGIGRKVITFPLVVERFAIAAQTIDIHHIDNNNNKRSRQMVVLWALLMGRLSSLVSGDEPWFVTKAKALADALGLRTWADVSDALRAFPWVAAMHDAPGREFWDEALALSVSSCTD